MSSSLGVHIRVVEFYGRLLLCFSFSLAKTNVLPPLSLFFLSRVDTHYVYIAIDACWLGTNDRVDRD